MVRCWVPYVLLVIPRVISGPPSRQKLFLNLRPCDDKEVNCKASSWSVSGSSIDWYPLPVSRFRGLFLYKMGPYLRGEIIPVANMEPKNDGLQVRNLLFQGST